MLSYESNHHSVRKSAMKSDNYQDDEDELPMYRSVTGPIHQREGGWLIYWCGTALKDWRSKSLCLISWISRVTQLEKFSGHNIEKRNTV